MQQLRNTCASNSSSRGEAEASALTRTREQSIGDGQNGYSFPLLWSFRFHFLWIYQYIVETFPRFTINPDYLPPLSTFPFLVSWKAVERLQNYQHGTFLLFLGHEYLSKSCLKKNERKIRSKDKEDERFVSLQISLSLTSHKTLQCIQS